MMGDAVTCYHPGQDDKGDAANCFHPVQDDDGRGEAGGCFRPEPEAMVLTTVDERELAFLRR